MSADEIAALKAEAEATQAQAEAEEPVTGPSLVMPDVDPGLSVVMGKVAYALSYPVCRKARVTPLEAQEAEAIGAAVAMLVTVYDVGPKDPKGAAWMGLGLVMVGVIGNRRRLEGPEAPPAPDAVPDAVPVGPAFGVPINQTVAPGA